MDNNIQLQWSYDGFVSKSSIDLYATKVYPSYERETIINQSDISGNKIIRARRRVKIEMIVHFIEDAINSTDYKWTSGEHLTAPKFKIQFVNGKHPFTEVIGFLPDSFFTTSGYDKVTAELYLNSYSENHMDGLMTHKEVTFEFMSVATYYK